MKLIFKIVFKIKTNHEGCDSVTHIKPKQDEQTKLHHVNDSKKSP